MRIEAGNHVQADVEKFLVLALRNGRPLRPAIDPVIAKRAFKSETFIPLPTYAKLASTNAPKG